MASRAVRELDDEGSERTCAVTRLHRPPEAMIRFVLDPAGNVTPDIRRKLPGRGVWVTATAVNVAKAAGKGIFTRAFRSPATVPPELVEMVDKSLERDVLQAISMSNKAGLVAPGMFQVEKAVADGKLAAIFHATDSSKDGHRKIAQLVRRTEQEGASVRFFKILSSEQMGLALGRPSVVHAALRRGPATDALLARAQRLEIFRGLAAVPPALDSGIPGDESIAPEIGQGPGIENE